MNEVSKIKSIILCLAVISSFIIISELAALSATVSVGLTCSPCKIGRCDCIVTDCLVGSALFFTTSDCRGEPSYEIIFTQNSFNWAPQTAGTYNYMVLCDNKQRSYCSPQSVVSGDLTTSTALTAPTTKPVTTIKPECEDDSDCNTGFVCKDGECALEETTTTKPSTTGGADYTMYIFLGIIIILVIVYMVYFLSRKGKPKAAYETLYRKWSK